MSDILNAQMRMTLRLRKARAALREAGYASLQQSPRGFCADAATTLRAYLNMNEPLPSDALARVTLLVEAAIESLDEADFKRTEYRTSLREKARHK